jgi:hypothetical protein
MASKKPFQLKNESRYGIQRRMVKYGSGYDRAVSLKNRRLRAVLENRFFPVLISLFTFFPRLDTGK